MDLILDINTEIEGFCDLINEDDIKEYVSNVLNKEYKSDKTVYMSILFTGNEDIQIINKKYRQKDSATDVISFAYHESNDYDLGPYDTLGDIVISLERVAEQAEEYGHSEKRELYYVLTHGILHLLGYDHMNEHDKEIMRAKEEALLGAYGYTR